MSGMLEAQALSDHGREPGPIRVRRRNPLRNRPLAAGCGLLLVVLAMAALAPILAPIPPTKINFAAILKPPSLAHLCGTDGIGRDVWSRMLYGARISLAVAGAGMVGSLLVGTAAGLLRAFGGSRPALLIDTLIDIQLAFPYVLLAIAITSVVRPSIPVLILLMILSGWAGAARVVRSVALQEHDKDYVKAATILGVSQARIALRHVLPSVVPSLIVLAAMQMAAMIVFEATLSFLGMGLQPPTPSLGGIMLDGRAYIVNGWWLTTLPGVAIMMASLALVLIGDGLQRALHAGRADAGGGA